MEDDRRTREAMSFQPPVDPVRAVRAEDLFGGMREIRVIHGQEEYRLRMTRNNKLILTK